ncbi:MAG: branched-chain amino acid ABC transporter permease [Paracoccaceae bacterium]
MSEYLQMGLTGLNLGLMYALIAIGLTLIFGVMRIIQYAHGEMYMLGAFTLYYWHAELGLPYWPGVAFSAVLIFCVGAVLQVVLFRPLQGKNILYSLAVSLGLVLIISGSGQLLFGTTTKGIPSAVSGGVLIAGAFLSYERMVISAVSIGLILALWWFLRRSVTGFAIRAVAEDPQTAALQGIQTGRIHWIAFGIGSSMAAIAGCMMGTLLSIVPTMGFLATIKAFMIVIMGGLGSVVGALIGGLILGMIDSVVTTTISGDIAIILSFVVIFLILVFRPSGLFGQNWD